MPPSFEDLRGLDLGQRLFVDSNIPDEVGEVEATTYLYRMRDERRISIFAASVLNEEAQGASDDTIREHGGLQDMAFSPAVWGRSHFGESVYASEQDSEQLEEVLSILVQFGRERDRMLNDARHLQSAIRYAADAFVTRDRFLLNRNDEILERYRLRIVTPEQEADLVRRLAHRAEGRTDR